MVENDFRIFTIARRTVHGRAIHCVAARRIATIGPVHSPIGQVEIKIDRLRKSVVKKLDVFAKKYFSKNKSIELSPQTRDLKIARSWLAGAGGDVDGVIAKHLELPYQSGNRHGMVKVKRLRTADCVVGGFRYASEGKLVGSMLLGLYDDEGLLHHVGFTSSFTAAEKPQLTKKLEALIKPPGFTGRAPGGPSRWSTDRSAEWKPLATKLVIEVQYDHFTGGRFRHGTKFLRWRPDKKAAQCTMEQVQR